MERRHPEAIINQEDQFKPSPSSNYNAEDEVNRRVCAQKISKGHKICGKCGFLYVKLKHHRQYCQGIVEK